MESLDILEQRIDRLIAAYTELKERVRELGGENQRLRENAEQEKLQEELAALREEREKLRQRLSKLLQQLESLGV